jgi:N-acetylmuramoyl-L-alanine amidase CwlA
MTYRVQHIPTTQTLQRPGLKMTPNTLTIHSTANPSSTAQNERDNLARANNDRQASFHIVVDAEQAIECIPLEEVAWHAGDGRTAGGGNMSSIGLEICESGDREKTLLHAVEVAAFTCNRYGWGVEKLRQHYDWSGKNCPRILRDTGKWDWFVAEVGKRLAGAATMPEWLQPKPAGMPILAPASGTVAQAQEWARGKNATDVFIQNAALYWQIAPQAGVDPVVAYAQYAHESGYGKHGGTVPESYCNPCGLKVTAGGGNDDPNAHKHFASWAEGVRAQIDHLALYAGAAGYPMAGTPDPRHFPYLHGTAKTVEELGGKWAPSAAYGAKLLEKALEIRASEDGHPDPVGEPGEPGVPVTPEPLTWEQEKALAWERVTEQGVMDGTNPEGNVTREQFAVILNRLGLV